MNATTMLNGVFGSDCVIRRLRGENKTKRESSQSGALRLDENPCSQPGIHTIRGLVG